MGQHHPVNAIGQLRNQNLFQGANASIIEAGLQWKFH
jgi:hypothetical protein